MEEEKVRLCKEEVKNRKKYLQVWLISTRMEGMKKISSLTKKINAMKKDPQQVTTLVMELHKEDNTQYLNITKDYEKYQKIIE